MQLTGNLSLKKPEGTDTVNIDDINGNMDKLDVEVVKKASSTVDGRMSKEDKSKLDGIASGANKYTHPSSHVATMITQDSTHRFVSDAEKSTWNGKSDSTQLVIVKDQTITSSSWTEDVANARWYYQVTDASVTTNTVVNVNVHLGDLEKAGDLLPITESFSGYYRLYADAQPTENFEVDVVKQN